MDITTSPNTDTHTHTHTPHSTSKTNKKNNLTRSSYDNVKTKENYGMVSDRRN